MATLIAGSFLRADGWWRLQRDFDDRVFRIVKLEGTAVQVITRSQALDYFRMIRDHDRYPDAHRIFDEPLRVRADQPAP